MDENTQSDMPEEEMPSQPSIEDMEITCENVRGNIRDLGYVVKALMEHPDFQGEQAFRGQHSEMKANIMLAYRHLEDARMRLGKVMQQIQGGISIFDRPEGKEAIEKIRS